MISPVGNLIGRMTSDGMSFDSLQCMSVSSRSKISVFLSMDWE